MLICPASGGCASWRHVLKQSLVWLNLHSVVSLLLLHMSSHMLGWCGAKHVSNPALNPENQWWLSKPWLGIPNCSSFSPQGWLCLVGFGGPVSGGCHTKVSGKFIIMSFLFQSTTSLLYPHNYKFVKLWNLWQNKVISPLIGYLLFMTFLLYRCVEPQLVQRASISNSWVLEPSNPAFIPLHITLYTYSQFIFLFWYLHVCFNRLIYVCVYIYMDIHVPIVMFIKISICVYTCIIMYRYIFEHSHAGISRSDRFRCL